MSDTETKDGPQLSRVDELLLDINEYETQFKGHWDFGTKYEKTFVKMLADFNDAEKKKVEEIMLACARNGRSQVLEHIAYRIMDRRKLIDWKNRKEFVDKMFSTIVKSAREPDPDNNKHYTSFVEKLIQILTTNQILERHIEAIYSVTEASFTTLDDPNCPIHNAALTCVTKFPWGDYPDLVVKTMKLLLNIVKHNPDLIEGAWLYTTATIAPCMMLRVHGSSGAVVRVNGKSISDDPNASHMTTVHQAILADMTEMFHICSQQEWQCSEDPSKQNISYAMCKCILEDFLSAGSTSPELVRPMIDDIKELYECGDETLQRDAGYIMTAMAAEIDLTGDYTHVFIERFLAGKMPQLMTSLLNMYKQAPDKFTPMLPRFIQLIKSNGGQTNIGERIMVTQLLSEVAKQHPEHVTNEMTDAMIGQLNDESLRSMAFMYMDTLSAKRPKDVQKYDDKIIAAIYPENSSSFQAAMLLPKLATDQAHERKYMTALGKVLPSVSQMLQMSIISQMRTIGLNCPKVLGEHRKQIETLRENPALKDICQAALDVIEGRSLEGVAQDVQEQKKDIVQLDSRVTNTEGDVKTLKTDVKANTKDIGKVKTDVSKQGQQLNELKEVVDETVDKVEELDHKTLSHAPVWSRDVAQLLNPVADHDWRLLAFRLGFTADDIRNWATQANPCLSLFDEWFATHKTREATYGVLKTLVEMDRKDAAVIVEKALDAVANIVEEDDDEPATPPPVFLSYQWAHQAHVKLLKRHLVNAGYSCWMDVGQMGGGDKLFGKIDSGIRAAKIIVCCVTEQYATSPNCNRELALAVNLGKPIIPLLVEKMSWPPPGAMGPIFGEYLFVRFFQRPGEETKDDRYWGADKFQELLMQLRLYMAPEMNLIADDSMYKNWWQPPEEIIVIKAVEKKTNNKPINTTASPDVFISYQWDKQPQIKALYRRLTSQGFSCWLDIMQMGGGDTLYDKIDKGVRGCQVVVSCATTKYALSANCRREVSLADAIKKPIIPLLLENMSWPPVGPMSMVFSSLLYIDFTKPNDSVQNTWTCPQFEQLVSKIQQELRPQLTEREKSTVKAVPPKTANSSQPADKQQQQQATTARQATFVREKSNVAPSPTKPSPGNRPAKQQAPPPPPPPTSAAAVPPTPAARSAPQQQSPAKTPQRTQSTQSVRNKPQAAAPATNNSESNKATSNTAAANDPPRSQSAPPENTSRSCVLL